MNRTFVTLAAVLLASGCAQNGQVKPPAEPDVSSPIASTTPSGASAAGIQQAAAATTAGHARTVAPAAP